MHPKKYYLETDKPFDNKDIELFKNGVEINVDDKPYIIKASPDESPINIQQILDFMDNNHFKPEDIRKTVENLSWKIQMKKVVDEV